MTVITISCSACKRAVQKKTQEKSHCQGSPKWHHSGFLWHLGSAWEIKKLGVNRRSRTRSQFFFFSTLLHQKCDSRSGQCRWNPQVSKSVYNTAKAQMICSETTTGKPSDATDCKFGTSFFFVIGRGLKMLQRWQNKHRSCQCTRVVEKTVPLC